MPLDIPQYHIDGINNNGINNRIFNSYQSMINFIEKSGYPSDEIHYHVDYAVQTPDPDEFSWNVKL